MTNIFDAIENNDLGQLQKAIENGADVNEANINGATPLIAAAHNGHLNVIERLVENGADVNKANINGVTPVYVAAQEGHSEVVQLLLAKEDIDVNAADNNGATPLYAAAINGHSEVAQLLLEKGGIEVNAAREDGVTPLHVAAQKDHVNIGANLLIHGANFDDVNSEFYKKAINHIAQGSNDYDEYRLKKLAFAMGDHKRLGAESHIRTNLDDNTIKIILDLTGPPKIELNKMQQQHRDAVEKRINELQQKKVAPGSNVAANGVITQISPALHQL